jgi:Protein of unknown function (DUF1553)/Protein of unknown function (DUF1549)
VLKTSGLVAMLVGGLVLAAADAPKPEYRESERSFWSLQPRSHPAIPEFTTAVDRAWASSPIDAFVLRKLTENNLRPAPEADRATLIRRVYFDLWGLPPSPADVADFVNDPSPGAYEKLVDRLLASPHYGERWAQHWLDVVRYAETEGFEYDRHMAGMWRYRDYVIDAFNEDKPYDRFVREQIAGDEIAPDNNETLIAAGLYRLGAVRRNAGNQEVASSRNEVLTERTDIIGSAFLGLTVGCARCHDHMFDPIRQKDYYRLQAFMASTEENNIVLASEEEQKAWEARVKEKEDEIKELTKQLEQLQGEEKGRLQQKIRNLEVSLPEPLPTIATVKDDYEHQTPIHVLERGDYGRKKEQVAPRLLGVLMPEGAPELDAYRKNLRVTLADWLTDPDHPLTARVMVNRMWMYHFGQGIVNTPNDFGRNGDRPSHPELLDYLANAFVAGGWHMKPIHRMIVLSKAYRQSSHSALAQAAAQKDPQNRLLWKFSRSRLEAEEIRDAMLTVSGTLNLKAGGKSIMVPVDEQLVDLLYKPAQWKVPEQESEDYRRSIYLIAKRNLRLPFMEVFDQPALLTSCARRQSSTHAPQALELMNGTLANGLAKTFAERLRNEVGGDPEQLVERAYLLAAGRMPTPGELKPAVEFLKTQPLSEFALAMFNLNDFLYVN